MVIILPGCLSLRASYLQAVMCELKLSWEQSLKKVIMVRSLQYLRKKNYIFGKFYLRVRHLKAASFLKAYLEVYDVDSCSPQCLSCPPKVLVALYDLLQFVALSASLNDLFLCHGGCAHCLLLWNCLGLGNLPLG